ncbi:hypothetical protein EYZ11_003070 [Aspergillus tanneri]|uniref:Uncharacterized protein n=1 Tax=Aspergillus tanneri TaxID=1220188 RepID=A0A4S3JTU4_9EURO|nr:hypothetical protein EYZ11_003070 [Aspergillus tanneri]
MTVYPANAGTFYRIEKQNPTGGGYPTHQSASKRQELPLAMGYKVSVMTVSTP